MRNCKDRFREIQLLFFTLKARSWVQRGPNADSTSTIHEINIVFTYDRHCNKSILFCS